MNRFLPVLACCSLLACSGEPEESPRSSSARLDEYVHLYAKSKFAVGPNAHETSEFGMDKVVGDWGVFGTDSNTRMVLALPNADAPPRQRPPLSADAETHNAAVRSYFVDRGLAVEEVDTVTANAEMTAGSGAPEPAFVAFTTVLSRQYAGIPVAESFAWARLNDLEQVVTESVYWPGVPPQVTAAADQFQKQLEDADAKQAFFSKVPAGGHLVIHHTPGTWDAAFEASVAWDVAPTALGKTTHYDVNGDPFELPHEK